MSKICEHYEELVSRSLDAPLCPEEVRELEQHLQGCQACRGLRGDLMDILAELEREVEHRPHEQDLQAFGDRVMASIKDLSREASSGHRRRWFVLGTAVAGIAAAALLVASLIQRSGDSGGVDPDIDVVTGVTGLEVRRVGLTWRTANVPTEGPISTLHLRDGSRIELERDTVLRIADPGAGYRSRMELLQGRLTAHVSKAKGRFVVETATGSVEALGTAFALGVSNTELEGDGEGEREMVTKKPLGVVMSLAVLAGTVLVHSSWGQETLVQGEKREITAWAVKGRVVDPKGQPIQGAQVWAEVSIPYQSAAMMNPGIIAWRSYNQSQSLIPANLGPYSQGPVLTDAKGAFFVKNLRSPMRGLLTVMHPSYVPLVQRVDRKSARLPGDGLMDVGTLQLERGQAVRGRVVDGQGQPVIGANVAIVDRNQDRYGNAHVQKFTQSDESGHFVIHGLRPGEKGRVLGAWNAVSPAVSRELGADPSKKEIVLTLLAAKAQNRIRVRVIQAEDGSPMTGCRIRLLKIGAAGPFDRRFFDQRQSDQRGRAEFGCVTEGEYIVEAVPPDQIERIGIYSPPPWSVSKVCKSGDHVELALMPSIEMRGAVVDGTTGEPVTRFRVQAMPDPSTFGQEYRARYGNANEQRLPEGAYVGGVFTLSSLRSGKWKIHILADGYRPFRKLVEIELQREPKQIRCRLLRATGSVVGQVIDEESGQPLEGALVTAYEWSPRLYGINRRYSESDAKGRFKSTGLVLDAEIVQKFWINKKGYLQKELAFKKGSLPPGDLGRMGLVKECVITGTLLDANGKPLDRVTVVGRRETFRSKTRIRVLTDHRGRFRIGGLRPGVHYLWVEGKQIEKVKLSKPGEIRRLEPRKL